MRPPTTIEGWQPYRASCTDRATNSERDIPYRVNSLESSLADFAASLSDESSMEAFRKALIEHDNSIRVALTNIEVIEKQIADSLNKNKEVICHAQNKLTKVIKSIVNHAMLSSSPLRT
jgi:hypothetical protein